GGDGRRRLAAVLVADVVGYSRLMGVDEEGTHRRLAGYVKNLLEPKIAANHGRLIRTAGDGFLVEFDSAVDAVRCGLDIQRELADHNAGVPAARRIQLRIGINAGDVIVENQEIYGKASTSQPDWKALPSRAGFTSRAMSAISCKASPVYGSRIGENAGRRTSLGRSGSIASSSCNRRHRR